MEILDDYPMWHPGDFGQRGADIDFSDSHVLYPKCIDRVCGPYYLYRLEERFLRIPTAAADERKAALLTNLKFICPCQCDSHCTKIIENMGKRQEWTATDEAEALLHIIKWLSDERLKDEEPIYGNVERVIMAGFAAVDYEAFERVRTEYKGSLPLYRNYLPTIHRT